MLTGPGLAALNATFNSLAAICIVIGLSLIWRRRWRLHMWTMLTATVFSALFLTSYLARYYLFGSHPFGGPEWMRIPYYVLLISHVSLAIIQVPLILTTLWRAWKGWRGGEYAGHRRMARITYPIWLYVSVTGVVVYLLLYQIW